MFILVGAWIHGSFWLTILLFLVLTVLQIISLLNYLHQPNNELKAIIHSLENQTELTPEFKNYSNASAAQLQQALHRLLKKHQDQTLFKNEESLFYKNIVQHAGIGLIAIDTDGKVVVINNAAKKLLQVYAIKYITELQSLSPALVSSIFKLKTAGRDLVKLKIDNELVQLSVFAIELMLNKKTYKMVTLQNINSELEEMEMDAWQNLVRVLTHEIMNSVTPISSLAATVADDLNQNQAPQELLLSQSDKDDLLLAIHTIQRRSDGLIRFVKDFRNLTHIPTPKFETIELHGLLSEIQVLLQQDFSKNNIEFSTSCQPGNLSIEADKSLIEQVIINLIKNAIQSFDEETNRLIEVKAFKDTKNRVLITVKDNGSGIEEETLERIFIPFFSTKKTGSGIGLSLSRQIMRKHRGTLTVASKIDEGTEFTMRF